MQDYIRKISIAGGLIFLATAFAGVVGGFAVLFPLVQDHLHANLQRSLEIRDEQFNKIVEQGWLDSFIFANQPLLGTALKELEVAPRNKARSEQIRNVAAKSPRFGFSAVIFRDRAGREIARNGSFVKAPDLDVVLHTSSPSHLLWKNGFVLHTHADVVSQGKVVGTLDAERPLLLSTNIQQQVYLGSTTDFAVCAPATTETMNCFPFRSTEGKVLLNLPARINGDRIPMSYALANKTGLIHTRDYRGEDVIAAYAPIGNLGLGSVLKIDADELYLPISSKYKTLIILLLALVAAGMLLLYKQVLPLVRRMSREIDERKQAVDKLSESEEQYRLLVGAMDEGVVLQEENTTIIAFNKSAERILGLTADQLRGKTSFDPDWRSIHEDGSPFPGDTHPVVKTLKTGIPQSDVIMGIHKPNGELTWISINAQPIFKEGKTTPFRVVATMRDITERKLSEQRMRQFEAAIDTTHEGFCMTDGQGKLLQVNAAYARMTGYSIDELLGMNIVDLQVSSSQEKINAHLEKVVSRGWDLFETSHRCKDGREIELEVSISYIPESGQFVAFMRDISQHKEDQRKILLLTKLYSALSQANHALISCKNEAELFEQICRIAVEFGSMQMAWVGKPDETDGLIKPVASYGAGLEYLDGIEIGLSVNMPGGNGPTAIAFRENRAVVVQNFSTDPLLAAFHERARPYGWGASATFPILRGGQVYASIALYHAEKNPFSEEMVGLMSEMMVNIGYGLERFELEAEKLQAEEAMRLAAAIYESSAEAVMVTDENNLIVDVNPAFTNITGYTLEEIRGKNPRIFKSGKHDQSFYRQMWQSIQEEGHWQGEIWDRRKDGELRAKWLNISVIRHPDGRIYRHVAEFSDITEKKRTDELIWTQANFDPLTNLPNRRLLADRIQQAMASGVRSGLYGALIALDMDHFKHLNDTQGHTVGDELLIEVARRLLASVREEDTVARMGGDEFIVVLSELDDNPEEAATLAEQVAEKIRSQLSAAYQLGEVEYHTTPSIGIVLFHGHADSQENLLAHVDTAMYQAKARGRNTICFFDTSMQLALEQRNQMERALRAAIVQQEFMLYYQLQVDNRGRPLGVEALLRWKHPEIGMVSPAQFIPLAEETGLILPIGSWVLETACAQLASWQADPRLRHLGIAINVSARQFRESTFVAQVCGVVEKSGISPEGLKLELTESLVLEDIEDTISKMQELKARGIKFSMDDFGTGYSSLAYLTRLPFDQLKIDQSFIRNVTIERHSAAIVQTVISMAQSLGVEVIAEGVETEEQREFLELRGCKAYQGYLFARPLPVDELEQKL